jgi:hypothetical protein
MAQHKTLALLGETVQTTDATATSLSVFTTKPNTVYFVVANVVAMNTIDPEGGAYRRYAAFRTNAAGTLTQIGTTQTAVTLEDNSGWDATIDSSGTDIRVRVTGEPAVTINWRADVNINKVGTGADFS